MYRRLFGWWKANEENYLNLRIDDFKILNVVLTSLTIFFEIVTYLKALKRLFIRIYKKQSQNLIFIHLAVGSYEFLR